MSAPLRALARLRCSLRLRAPRAEPRAAAAAGRQPAAPAGLRAVAAAALPAPRAAGAAACGCRMRHFQLLTRAAPATRRSCRPRLRCATRRRRAPRPAALRCAPRGLRCAARHSLRSPLTRVAFPSRLRRALRLRRRTARRRPLAGAPRPRLSRQSALKASIKAALTRQTLLSALSPPLLRLSRLASATSWTCCASAACLTR
jgi:hypothetical protein